MFKICVVFVYILITYGICYCKTNQLTMQQQVEELVKLWSEQLGRDLRHLSVTMTRKGKIIESFKPLKNKIRYENGQQILREIVAEVRSTMDKKTQAVERIAQYAEYLAYHRKQDYIGVDPTKFNFYNSNNITNTTSNRDIEDELKLEIRNAECVWWCDQKDLNDDYILPKIMFSKKELNDLFDARIRSGAHWGGWQCDCENPPDRTRPEEHYNVLPLHLDPKFGKTKVNTDLSVVKINVNIFERDEEVLQGIRWTEPLDLIFKDNLKKDPTLKYQYFASPLGYMRHFPAVQWSDERYAQTYDPRTRSWYTEAMTSPKDILILLDKSGSVCKKKRKIAAHIVNNILDTLNDNDFVNIYLFANDTEPLVPCFMDTLVQANEENLRLLRETLIHYKPQFQADIAVGLTKAFDILAKFRKSEASANCSQAIMLITEAAFLNDQVQFFNYSNWQYDTPVRIFTYQLERDDSDARLLEWVACSNQGYFVNVSLMEEVREKALQYINVMSRPINFRHKHEPMFNRKDREAPIWSYLYIDLADRRYTNWLWRKQEGNRQRAIFLDHAKREFMRLQKVLTSESHFLLQETHDYEKYEVDNDDDYMTTLSLPVYGNRREDIELIGVAGVDVPIKLLNSLIPHYKIGVNGYAFIITNNGYILMHPGHIREFDEIPKPTFNRVDLLEVEILDDTSEPRLFSESIVRLRDQMVLNTKQHAKESDQALKVKFALDNMKRIILIDRKYYFMSLDHFTVAIALPEDYGLMMVKDSPNDRFGKVLLETDPNWAVHPDWVYCKDVDSGKDARQVVLDCLPDKKKAEPLLRTLLFDANATAWFQDEIEDSKNLIRKYGVEKVFLATHSGLTRWKFFFLPTTKMDNEDNLGEEEDFPGHRTIDEDWYKRTVEENFSKDENMFFYSVPFEISGYELDTMITSTTTIFVNATDNLKIKRSPVAVTGLQFNHHEMLKIYKTITQQCGSLKHCKYTCKSDFITCFILDNNAYVVLSDEREYTGRFIGNIIKPVITHRLIENGVFKHTRMFNYQAICQKPYEPKTKNAATTTITIFRKFLENMLQVTNWALATILMLISSVTGGRDYESNKNETRFYEKLEINKTVPTPCDQEMWLYILGNRFDPVGYPHQTTEGCDWYYIVKRIPNSNLLFMAVNAMCEHESSSSSNYQAHTRSPTPVEIDYNETLACYIATHNNFSRRPYMKCHKKSDEEKNLNKDTFYCGHTWK